MVGQKNGMNTKIFPIRLYNPLEVKLNHTLEIKKWEGHLNFLKIKEN